MMITWSPTSMYGTYCGFSLPLNTSAALVARRPSVLPLASTTNHLRSTFLPLGIKVPISLLPSKRLKNPKKPAQSALARANPAHGPNFHPLPNKSVRVRSAGLALKRELAAPIRQHTRLNSNPAACFSRSLQGINQPGPGELTNPIDEELSMRPPTH